MREMKYKRSSDTCAVAVLLLSLSISACSDNGRAKQIGPRAVPVKIGVVMQQDVPLQIRAIGNVEAYNTVSVKALVGGAITSVNFREGQEVQEGSLLFQIDARPYEAALKQAEAQLARDLAQAKNAEDQAKRYAILVQKDYVSKDQYDQIRANADALAAAVQADKATVENARLQLAYCTISSPINGRTGSIQIKRGNVVKANDLALVTINQLVPINVSFAVPEQELASVKRYRASGELRVEASLAQSNAKPVRGTLTFIDNAVNTSTGTILLKATFSNRDHALWPGQFVDVTLTLTTERKRVTVPAAAVQTGQQGQFVFVIKEDGIAEMRHVTLGRTIGDRMVIEQGLRPGETVVTDGQLRLLPGTKVEIKNEKPGIEQGLVTETLSTQRKVEK